MPKNPAVAVVFLQPQCNMTCTFCVTEDDFSSMTFDQAINLLDHLKSLGITTVVIGGGEPFDWPGDVVKLSRIAKKLGFTVQVGTNAVALPEGFEHIDSIDRYVIPIESAQPEPHDAMRLYKNSHHSVILNVLDKLRTARKSVTLSTVITTVNRAGIVDLAHYLQRYNVGHIHAWHLYRLITQGRGGAHTGRTLQIPEDEYHRICDAVRAMDLGFPVYKRIDMYNSRTVEFFWYEGDRIITGSDARNA
ncbi:MAG: radical SAM protein [Phycisphaerales bacterium]|nr:radical SAM protein [Phycisphaerales bacterium]